MRGRKPKPDHLRAIDGGAGHRPDRTADAVAKLDSGAIKAGMPECPESVRLHPDAFAAWLRLGPQLVAAGLVAPLFEGALAAYCTAYGRYIQAARMLNALPDREGAGLIVTSPNGYPQTSAWLHIQNKAMDQMRQWSAELGLTPAALTRVSRAAQGDLFDDFEGFLQGGGS